MSLGVVAFTFALFARRNRSRPRSRQRSHAGWIPPSTPAWGFRATTGVKHYDARRLVGAQLDAAILAADAPAVVHHAAEPSDAWVRDRFLAAHGDVALGISTGVAVASLGPESAEAQRMNLRTFAARLRDGSLPRDAYCFCDVGGTSLESAAPILGELFERLATHALAPLALRDAVRRHGLPGRVRLAMGGAAGFSDGNGFHNHGPALNLLLAGRKRWCFLGDGPPYPRCGTERWLEQQKGESQLWACTQEVGDIVWVPAGLGHAVLNDGECVALAIQLDQLTFENALHVAAAAGRAATVRALLASGAWDAEATNGIGETPRQMAAERGHAEVVELLVGRGAIRVREALDSPFED